MVSTHTMDKEVHPFWGEDWLRRAERCLWSRLPWWHSGEAGQRHIRVSGRAGGARLRIRHSIQPNERSGDGRHGGEALGG